MIENAELWACGLTRVGDAALKKGYLTRSTAAFMRGGMTGWSGAGAAWRRKVCGPGAALSHYSAAALWRLVEIDESRPIDVTVPMRGARDIPGVSITAPACRSRSSAWTRSR